MGDLQRTDARPGCQVRGGAPSMVLINLGHPKMMRGRFAPAIMCLFIVFATMVVCSVGGCAGARTLVAISQRETYFAPGRSSVVDTNAVDQSSTSGVPAGTSPLRAASQVFAEGKAKGSILVWDESAGSGRQFRTTDLSRETTVSGTPRVPRRLDYVDATADAATS